MDVEPLQNRFGGLSEACLSVSDSFDVNTVLNKVVEHARALTGGRYGVVAVTDDSGKILDCVTSGFTPDERQLAMNFPGGRQFYEHLRELPEALNVRNLADHLKTLGFTADMPGDFGRVSAFFVVAMRNRGTHVGNLLVAGKESGLEFTVEDQEVLGYFASQAATAIANARRYQRENRAKADFEALFETAPVGLVVFDTKTAAVQLVNREAQRILGALDISGHTVPQLQGGLTVRRANGREISLDEYGLKRTLGAITTGRAEEVVIEMPDGRSVTSLVSARSIRSAGREAESVVVTLQDMTPQEDLERMRNEFLRIVSHELQTPLASVKGCTATVLGASSSPAPDEMLQFFRIIDGQADRMRGLILDLLDAGHIKAGTLSVDPQPSAVPDLVDLARSTFLSAGGRNPLQIDLPTDLPRVLADQRRIVQVLDNLLANASRHSPERSPIRISAVQDGVHVAISVADEGEGVSADMLPHLFRAGRRDETRSMVGPGLGLAICKGLVEAHVGQIWVESAGPSHGARFTFSLPVAVETTDQSLPDRARGAKHAGRDARRVLVVDDDPHMLQCVRHTLEEADYSVVVTGNPQDVPRLLEAKRPHLVLLDLVLPGKDGIELMDDIPAMRNLPVIFLSAYGREETVVRALERGAVDYMVKPFSPAELLARIRTALRGLKARPKLFEVGELAINYDAHRVTLGGQTVDLTATEFVLLRELAVNAGRVLTYEALLRRVWGRSDSSNVGIVRAFIKKLRHKLADDPADPIYIFTVQRVGYRMAKRDQG